MKTVEILGANRFENYTKMRDGSRAIIIEDGKILLTHELNSGWWLLPGGGIEVCYLLERLRTAKEHIEISIYAEDYYRIKDSEKKTEEYEIPYGTGI